MIASMTAASIGMIGSTAYFSPWLLRRRHAIAIQKELTRNRILALTYDDGPSENLTSQLLDLLRQHAATATFFMLGRNAKRFPQIADRVFQEGHDIGCHSNQHVNAWKVTPWHAVADIDAGYDRLSRWVLPNGMFRPPYGKMTLPTYWSIRRRGARVWWWTIDSGDTHKTVPEPKQVADEVLRHGGGIVLMHDLERSKERDHFVVEATATLLDLAKQESFNIAPLSKICR